MTISTPLNLGFVASSATTGQTLTIASAVAAHDVIVVWHYSASNSTVLSTLTDSASNTYYRIQSQTTVAPCFEIFICDDAAAMTSGVGTISYTTGTSTRHAIAAFTITGCINGPGSYDRHTTVTATRVAGTSSTTSASLPALNSYCQNQALLGIVVAGSSLGTMTQGGSFTALGGGTTNSDLYPAYQLITNGAAITYAPSWTTGATYCAGVIALNGKPASNTSRQAQATLTGVGT